jgi:peptide/nickel transport system permease protein
MNEIHLSDGLHPPSTEYFLGTDNLGRDMLSRVIFGARISMIVGLAAGAIAVLIALLIGVPSGYIGGKFDIVVQRFVDGWISFPSLVIFLAVVSIVGAGMLQLIIAIGVGLGILTSRIMRSAVIGVKENIYFSAAKAIGSPRRRILWRNVLPNIMAPALIVFSTQVPSAILTEAGLSFLGFGIPPPQPSWGGMLSGSGRSYMFLAPWMAIWPGLAISIVVYGINMFGDAVRDLLDPRLRGGLGGYSGTTRTASKRLKKAVQTGKPSANLRGIQQR